MTRGWHVCVQLATHFGLVGPASVHRLFKKMLTPSDANAWGDGAPEREGSICLGDFEKVISSDLQLMLPRHRLLGLWKALDADGSGLVCKGEWGRFMRFGSAERARPPPSGPAQPTPPADGAPPQMTPRRSRLTAHGDNPAAHEKQKLRAKRAAERKRHDERYVSQAYADNVATARMLEEEAQRLEAMLDGGKKGQGVAPERLPKILGARNA
jgi:hypothetical protein